MTWIDPTLYFLIGSLPVWQTTHDWVGALLGGLVALKAWRSTGSTKAAIANAAGIAGPGWKATLGEQRGRIAVVA